MKRGRRALLILCGCVLACVVWVVRPREREPSYQGRTLSEWLRGYRQPLGSTAPVISNEAADAVRHIGTNALSFLLKWMQEPQKLSPAREKFLTVAFRVAYMWKLGSTPREVVLRMAASRELRAASALWGFVILGTNASPAIPDLVELARKGEPWRSPAALSALGYLGKDALPPLLAFAADPRFPFRNEAMGALGAMHYIGTNAHPAVLWLIESLDDPKVDGGAADILGRLCLESEISVPALAAHLQSTNELVRRFVVIGLGKFGAQAQSVVPELYKRLDDPDAYVRDSATNALRAIARDGAR